MCFLGFHAFLIDGGSHVTRNTLQNEFLHKRDSLIESHFGRKILLV